MMLHNNNIKRIVKFLANTNRIFIVEQSRQIKLNLKLLKSYEATRIGKSKRIKNKVSIKTKNKMF